MPTVLVDPEIEERAWAELRMRRARTENTRVMTPPGSGARLATIVAAHPHIEPGVALALAKQGLDASSPEVQAVAQESEEMHKGSADRGVFGDVLNVAGDVVGEVADVAGDVVRPVARTAFTVLETPIQEFTGRAGQVLAGSGEFLSRAGTVAGALAGGAIGSVLPGAGTAAGAAAGGAFGTVAGGAIGGFLGDLVSDAELDQAYSTGVIAAKDRLAGRDIDIGSGYFSGGSVRQRQSQVMRDLGKELGLPDDMAFTLGRYLTKHVLEPGTLPFNIVSGVGDATLAFAGDPAAGGLKTAGAVGKSIRTFQPLKPSPLAEALGLVKGGRFTVMAENFNHWTDTQDAARFFQWAADSDHATLWRRLTNDGRVRNVPWQMVDELARTKNPSEAAGIVRRYVLGEQLPQGSALLVRKPTTPGLWSTWAGKTPWSDSRIFGLLPSNHGFKMNDVEGSIANLEATLRNGKVALAERDRIVGKAFRAFSEGETVWDRKGLYDVFVNDMPTALAEQIEEIAGVSASNASRMTKLWTDRLDSFRLYWIDEMGNEVRHPLTVIDEATGLTNPGPHTFSEMTLEWVPNMDWREIRAATASRFSRTLTTKGGFRFNVLRPIAEKADEASVLPFDLDKAEQVPVVGRLLARPDLERVFEPRALVSFMDWATSRWKLPALLRGAYIARVVGNEQGRIAANGGISLANHPIHAWGWITHRRGGIDPLGRVFKDADEAADDFAEYMRIVGANIGADTKEGFLQRTGLRTEIGIDEDGFARAAAEELAHLADDPVNRGILSRSSDEAKEWFVHGTGENGQGRKLRQIMMRNPAGRKLAEDSVAEKYVESIHERARQLVGDDQDLWEALRSNALPAKARRVKDGGRVRASDRDNLGTVVKTEADRSLVRFVSSEGAEADVWLDNSLLTPIKGKGKLVDGRRRVDGNLVRMIREKVGNNEWTGARLVRGEVFLKDKNRLDGWKRDLDRVLELGATAFIETPTKVASRSPAFRQALWRRMGDTMDLLTPEAQREVLSNARKAKLDKRFLEPIERAVTRGKTGTLTAEEATFAAHIHAGQEVGDLLYDWSQKGQFFDIHRNLAPFGEAWKEELTVWPRIIRDNPGVLRRFQQGMEGLRSVGVGEALAQIPVLGMGIPRRIFDGETGEWRDVGFFHVNANNEETFTYPFTGWFSEKLFGVPVPLQGRVQGLSLMSEVLPGIGPVTQLPLSWLLPNTPGTDDIDRLLFPFGRPDTKSLGGITREFIPAWAQKLLTTVGIQDPDQARTYGNSVKAAAAYLVSSGQVKRPETPGQVAELLEKSEDAAKGLWMLRTIANFTAPSAPSFAWMAQDKSGDLIMADQLRQEIRRFMDEDPRTGLNRFILRHGPQAFFHVNYYSKSLTYGAPVTREGLEWAEQNPEAKKNLPDVYGLFAPEGQDFDYEAYVEQFGGAERQALTFEQWVQAGNNRIARNVYENVRAVVGPKPNEQQRGQLRLLRQTLAQDYPGYSPGLGGIGGIGERITPDQAAEQLRGALDLASLQDHPVMPALRAYLAARDLAELRAKQRGFATFKQAAEAADIRNSLRVLAIGLVQRYPAFDQLWERVFALEMEDDL